MNHFAYVCRTHIKHSLLAKYYLWIPMDLQNAGTVAPIYSALLHRYI